MPNLLNTVPDYAIVETAHGTWRRYLYANGQMYSQYTSHRSFRGWPLVSIANGRSPENGRMAVARGVIALGQRAVGFVAIGQMVQGVIALGQVAVGLVAVGQVAVGVLTGVGQATCGLVAVGQASIGLVGWGMPGLNLINLPAWWKAHVHWAGT